MGIVFDEVVGSVADPAPAAQPEAAAAAPAEPRPDVERLRRELSILAERAARLAAD